MGISEKNVRYSDTNALIPQIGNTPLLSVQVTLAGKDRTIHLKLEGMNPTGSMKDRTGYALLTRLEEEGALKPGAIIVESTSGNLGAALAFQCNAKGYRFIAVVDPKTTQENREKMQKFGAHIEMVQQPDVSGGYLLSRLERVQQLLHCADTCVWTNQYANTANPLIHYTQTGPEIYRQMQGQVDAIFVPVSTGGTLAGIGRYFRENSPATHIIGVDARGSVIFGGSALPRRLTGIGSSVPSRFLDETLYTAHILIGDEEAFAFCRALYQVTGLKVGGSSGAVLAACMQYIVQHEALTNIVCICADQGENYDSSIFTDEWICKSEPVLRIESIFTLQEQISKMIRLSS